MNQIGGIAASSLIALVALGCSTGAPTGSSTSGCAKDSDCKGDRICVDGACTAPTAMMPVVDAAMAAPIDLAAIAPTDLGTALDGAAMSCTPGASWCDANGTTLWSCNHSGTDSSFVVDCNARYTRANGNSTNNPIVCATDHCPTDQSFYSFPGPGCCRKRNPHCVAQVTSDTQFSFTTWEVGTADDCGIFDLFGCAAGTTPVATVDERIDDPDPNKARALRLSIWLFPDQIMPGQTVRMHSLKSMNCSDPCSAFVADGVRSCGSFDGMVTLDSANPHARFHVDLQCMEQGKSDLRITGSFTSEQ